MYLPTEKEKRNCTNIVRNILNNDNDADTCKGLVDKIFMIAYSIGSDYSEKSLKSIAETLIN